jgi:hypothetical protein
MVVSEPGRRLFFQALVGLGLNFAEYIDKPLHDKACLEQASSTKM